MLFWSSRSQSFRSRRACSTNSLPFSAPRTSYSLSASPCIYTLSRTNHNWVRNGSTLIDQKWDGTGKIVLQEHLFYGESELPSPPPPSISVIYSVVTFSLKNLIPQFTDPTSYQALFYFLVIKPAITLLISLGLIIVGLPLIILILPAPAALRAIRKIGIWQANVAIEGLYFAVRWMKTMGLISVLVLKKEKKKDGLFFFFIT